MNYDVKVTIITLCFNSINTIEQTFKSVLSQNYSNLEYIVIDGGSTDGTIDVIKKYQDKLAYWNSEKDEGIADGFNKGIAKANGDIVGIINSDDWYAPDTITKVVETFINNPTADFVFGDIIYTDLNGAELYIQTGNPNYQKSLKYEMTAIHHPTVFVRRTVYQNYGGFDKGYRIAMDYEFLLRITSKGVNGLYIPTVLAFMRLGGESDCHCLKAYAEVREISMKYGYNTLLAWYHFCYKSIKILVRKKLQQIGLELVVRWFRIHVRKCYKYID